MFQNPTFLKKGGQGEVYSAYDNDIKVAVKIINKYELVNRELVDREVQKAYINIQINVLKSICVDSPNIVDFVRSGETNDQIFITTCFCDGGDLRNIIDKHYKSRSTQYIPEKTIISYLSDVLNGLEYIHGKNIVHRDIKPENILLCNNHCFITDFGVCSYIEESSDKCIDQKFNVTAQYCAPEVWNNNTNKKSDIWSLGCIIYELSTGKLPFYSNIIGKLKESILNDDPPPISSFYSKNLFDVILLLLKKNYSERPSAGEMLDILRSKYAHPLRFTINSPTFLKNLINEGI